MFYRVYMAAFLITLLGAFALATVRADIQGPVPLAELSLYSALLGLFAVLLVINALRTGRFGGPLMIPRPDVHHVLLAPIDRGQALRPTALRHSARAIALGSALGALGGFSVGQGLPGGIASWTISVSAFGVVVACLVVGIGLVTAASRLSTMLEALIVSGLFLIGLAGVVLREPFVLLPHVATFPLDRNPLAASFLVAPFLLGIGFLLVGRTPVEAAERRGELVALSRLALVMRDLRTVSLLRRRIRAEHARRDPWVKLPIGIGTVVRRDVRSLLRFPAGRLSRLIVLTSLAGLCIAISGGRVIFLIAVGFIHFLIAIDVIEGFAQEFDHPDLRDLHPATEGSLSLRHLGVPLVMMTGVAYLTVAALPMAAGLLGIFDTAAVEHGSAFLLIALLAAASAVIAAGLTLLDPKPLTAAASIAAPPEVAAVNAMARAVSAPMVAVGGLLPLLAVERALHIRDLQPITFTTLVVAVAIGEALFLGWFGARATVRGRLDKFMGLFLSFGRGSDQPVRGEPDPARPSSSVLECSRLTKSFDEVPVLGPITASVSSGEIVALVGPNGAGKTTLLRLAAGLLEPTEGGVRIEDRVAGSLPARAHTSFVPDVPVFYDDLSLAEHVEYVCALHGIQDQRAQMTDLLGRFNLDDRADDLPVLFSRGMKQKAAFVIGLCRPSNLLLLDEPFASIDRAARQVLLEVLSDARRSGKTVVVASHDIELFDIATRCIALRDGHLVYDGPVSEEARELMA